MIHSFEDIFSVLLYFALMQLLNQVTIPVYHRSSGLRPCNRPKNRDDSYVPGNAYISKALSEVLLETKDRTGR